MHTDPPYLTAYHKIKVKLLVNVAMKPPELVRLPLDQNRDYQKEGAFENNCLQPEIKYNVHSSFPRRAIFYN